MDEQETIESRIEALEPTRIERFDAPGSPEAPTGEDDRWQVGIVPPGGSLPQRFGAPAVVIALLRLAVLLVLAIPLLVLTGGVDPTKLTRFSWGDLAAPFGALLLVLAQRLAAAMRDARARSGAKGEKRKRIRPLAVVVEPAGVTLVRLAGRHSLSWSDLVGLGRRDDGGIDVIVESADGAFVVELPAAGWGRRLGSMLAGT